MSLLRDSQTEIYLISTVILTGGIVAAFILGWTIPGVIAVCVNLLLTVLYLQQRERLYKECTKVVEKFEEGDFSVHLSRNREGSFFSFLSRIDRLAMTLKSQNETEADRRQLVDNRISDISHQLKTPLAALLMYNEIVEQETNNPVTVAEFTAKSRVSLFRMQRLIQLLLAMTRLDSGSIVFEKEKYYIGELVREAIGDLMIRAENEHKEIILKGDEEGQIFCDKKWTMEAISNIVKNSLDHTEENGHIEISWNTSNQIVHIRIQDNGCGIARDDICHIFKRFYRSSENQNTGVGLGLPLAKSVVEGQGGTILLESIQGEGTTMTLSFMR